MRHAPLAETPPSRCEADDCGERACLARRLVLHDPTLAAPLRLIAAGLALHAEPFPPPPYGMDTASSLRATTQSYSTVKAKGALLPCCSVPPEPVRKVRLQDQSLAACLASQACWHRMSHAQQCACCDGATWDGVGMGCTGPRNVCLVKLTVCMMARLRVCWGGAGAVELLAARCLALLRSLTDYQTHTFLDQACAAPATRNAAAAVAGRATFLAGACPRPCGPGARLDRRRSAAYLELLYSSRTSASVFLCS